MTESWGKSEVGSKEFLAEYRAVFEGVAQLGATAMSTLTKFALGMMGRPKPAQGNASPMIVLPAPNREGGPPLMDETLRVKILHQLFTPQRVLDSLAQGSRIPAPIGCFVTAAGY